MRREPGPTFPRLLFVATLIAAASLLFRDLGLDGIATDEAARTAVEVEMLRGGHWLVPTSRGVPDTRKPPLSMWMSAASLVVIGESELALRLPAALFGLATVALVFAWAARLGGALAAMVAALALVTVPEFLFDHCARTNVPDSPLLFFTTASALAYAYGPPTVLGAIAAGALGGFALLTKGVAGVALLLVVISYELVTSRGRGVLSARPWTLAATAVAVAALWYVPAWLAAPAALGAEIERDLGSRIFGDGLFHRWPLHFLKLWKNFGFWLLALPIGLGTLVRQGDVRGWLAPVAAAVVLAIFTAAGSKYPWYALPAYPAVAVLIGVGVAAVVDAVGAGRRPVAATLGLIVIAALFAPGFSRAWRRAGSVDWQHSNLRTFEHWASATLPPHVPIVLFDDGIDRSFAIHEAFYVWKLRKRLRSVDSAADLCTALSAAPSGAFALVSEPRLSEVDCLADYPASLRVVRVPHAIEDYVAKRIVPYRTAAPPFFSPAAVVLDAATGSGFLSGWSDTLEQGKRRRRMIAPSAFVAIDLEPSNGATLALMGTWTAPPECAPSLRWNGMPLGSLPAVGGATFTLSPSELTYGKNVLELVRPCDGAELALERVTLRPKDDGAGGPPDVGEIARHISFGGRLAGRRIRDHDAPDGHVVAYGENPADPPAIVFAAPLDLEAGRYRASFTIRGRGIDRGSAAAVVEVKAQGDERRFARRELRLGEIVPDSGYQTVELAFALPARARIEALVEARGAGAEIRVGGVTIVR